MLDSFDGRLVKLEASILPIHRSTQNLTHVADSKSTARKCHTIMPCLTGFITSTDIDATLKATESIVKCMDLPSKEEALILKGYEDEYSWRH